MPNSEWIAEFAAPSERWQAEGPSRSEAGVALHRKWDDRQRELEHTHGHVPVFVRQYDVVLGMTFDAYWRVTYRKLGEHVLAASSHGRRAPTVHPITVVRRHKLSHTA